MQIKARQGCEVRPTGRTIIKEALLEALRQKDGEVPNLDVRPKCYILPRQEGGEKLRFKGPYFEIVSMGKAQRGLALATGKKNDMVVFSPTPFSVSFSGTGQRGVLSSVNGAIIPSRTDVRILGDTEPGLLYAMKMKSYAFKPLSSSVPVGFRLGDMASYLERGESLLLMLPLSTRGEVVLRNGGIMPFGDTQLPVVLGPDCQYFSITNTACQDFHYHNVLFETYVPMGNATIFCGAIGKHGQPKIKEFEVKPGEAIVIPPHVVHYAVLDAEPTFVFKSSKVSIVDEKASVMESAQMEKLISIHALARKKDQVR